MDDDGDDKDDTKRRTRNLSEKKRRDQFNMLVNELGTMVSTNNRKMDKSSILKSTISFLRNHNELTVRSRDHDINEEWKPAFLSNEEFTYLVLEALEGFVMVFSSTGRICYVSESITSLLGHNPADVVTKSIFDLAYEEDRPRFYNMLQNPAPAVESNQLVTSENEITFQCYLKRGLLDFRDEVTYELIQFHGHFRKNMEPRSNDDLLTYGDQEPRLLFVCTGTLYTPQLVRDVSLLDSNRNEFTSRHSLEWKFLFLDHRAPPIIGYLPFEVLGTSGYDYYHFDDLEKVSNCHEALMQKGEVTSCYYRFLTKGQHWIWLQTRYYITYHQWNSKPEFVVCTHRVVSYADLAKSVKQEEVQNAEVQNAEVQNAEVQNAEVQNAEVRNAEVQNAEVQNAEVLNVSEPEVNKPVLEEPICEEVHMVDVSPSYISETSEAFSTYHQVSQTPSVKSNGSTGGTAGTTVRSATASASWPRASHLRYAAGSDTASMSGESRSSQRNGSRGADSGIFTPYTPHTTFGLQRFENDMITGTNGRYYNGCDVEMVVYPNKPRVEPTLVPQHAVGTQYLKPAPYVSTVQGVLPLPLQPIHTVPVIVSNDHAQIQEQLQRKHEELQEMIVRQQEELRQVKEQLLLARLGMLQPIVNVPNNYVNPEEVQQNQGIPTPVIYDGNHPRPPPGYTPQPPDDPSDRHPHLPQ